MHRAPPTSHQGKGGGRHGQGAGAWRGRGRHEGQGLSGGCVGGKEVLSTVDSTRALVSGCQRARCSPLGPTVPPLAPESVPVTRLFGFTGTPR